MRTDCRTVRVRPAAARAMAYGIVLAVAAFAVAGGTLAGAEAEITDVPVPTPLVSVSADFDGDARADLAVLSVEPPLVTVFRSVANRTFTRLAELELGFSTETLVADDLDGDGAAEILAGNFPGRFVLVAWNDGSGGFSETEEVFAGVPPRALAVVDAGASRELAAAGGDPGQVALLELGPQRRFGAPVVLDCPVELPHILTAADLNGDGLVDLAVWGRSRAPFLAVMERVPGGDFTVIALRSELLDPGGFTAPVVAAADVDGDGSGDLLALVRGSAFGGVGVGRVLRTRRAPGGYEVAPWGLEIPLERPTALVPLARSAGVPDDVAIIAATAAGGLFAAMPNPDAPGGSDRPCTLALDELPRAGVEVVSAGDFDGDGDLDVAVPLERRDAVAVVYAPERSCSEAESCYVASPALAPGVTSPFLLAFARFDATTNGVLAAVGDAEGMLLRPGVGGFARGERFATPAVVRGIAAADLDGDGAAELLLSDFAQDAVEVISFAGGQAVSRSFALPPGALPEGVGAGALDGAGGLDIAVALRGLDEIAVFPSAPGGGFGAPLCFAAGERPRALALGDADGDGRTDIAVANDGAATITLLLADTPEDGAHPRFHQPLTLTLQANSRALALHDLDRNGRDDPVVLGDDGSLSILLSVAAGFSPRVFRVAADASPVAFVIADLDGVGRDDVAVASVMPPALTLFRGDAAALLVADGTLPLPRAENAPTSFSLVAADLHIDGLTDIAVADARGGVLTVLRPLGCAVPSEITFRRGDVDQSGRLEVTDSVRTLNHLFLDAGPLACPDAADANDDGTLDLTDAVTVLTYLFLSGPELPAPGAESCGSDATDDALPPCAGTCVR